MASFDGGRGYASASKEAPGHGANTNARQIGGSASFDDTFTDSHLRHINAGSLQRDDGFKGDSSASRDTVRQMGSSYDDLGSRLHQGSVRSFDDDMLDDTQRGISDGLASLDEARRGSSSDGSSERQRLDALKRVEDMRRARPHISITEPDITSGDQSRDDDRRASASASASLDDSNLT